MLKFCCGAGGGAIALHLLLHEVPILIALLVGL